MYSPSVADASKSVLVEVLRCLGSYGRYLVLVGGWAPYFILEKFGEGEHCGSVDIDLVLDPKLIDKKMYATIVETIGKRGYKPSPDNPFTFHRVVRSPFNGKEHEIEVDFLTEPEEAKRLHPQFLHIQRDLQAVVMPGCSVVFSHNFKHTIKGALPGGGMTSVSANVADVVGSLTMKGLALEGRYKEKDSYDIYSMVKFFGGGPVGAARQVKKHLTTPVIKRAMHLMREKFKTQRLEGPFQVARFMAPLDAGERDRIQADAYITAKGFFTELEGV